MPDKQALSLQFMAASQWFKRRAQLRKEEFFTCGKDFLCKGIYQVVQFQTAESLAMLAG